MWVMTDAGYVSAVVHRDDDRKLMVRARDRKSLVHCVRSAGIDESKIYQDFPSDYPYRVVMTRRQFKTFLKMEVNYMWYTNFKNAATKTSGKLLHDFYMRIWTASHMLTTNADKRANDKAWNKASKKWSSAKTGTVGFYSRYGTDHYANGISSFGPVAPTPEIDDESQSLLDDIDRQLAQDDADTAEFLAGKSHHDMTENEWIEHQLRSDV